MTCLLIRRALSYHGSSARTLDCITDSATPKALACYEAFGIGERPEYSKKLCCFGCIGIGKGAIALTVRSFMRSPTGEGSLNMYYFVNEGRSPN